MNYCPNCGIKLNSKENKCPNCGKILNEKIVDQYDEFNTFEKLEFNIKNIMTVYNFLKNNAVTTLFISIISMIFVSYQWLIFIPYLIFLYIYPLMSGKKYFPWEEIIPQKILKLSSLKVKEENKFLRPNNTDSLQEENKLLESNNTNCSSKKHLSLKHLTISFELVAGLILAVVGFITYYIFKDQASISFTQVKSIIEQGSLSNSGYFAIWGFVCMFSGIEMLIGGGIKLFISKPKLSICKTIGFLLMVIYGIILTYAYSNLVSLASSTAQSLLTGESSINKIQSLIKIIKFIPWLSIMIYVFGSFKGLFSLSKENQA